MKQSASAEIERFYSLLLRDGRVGAYKMNVQNVKGALYLFPKS